MRARCRVPLDLGAAAERRQAAQVVVVGEAAELEQVEPARPHVAPQRFFLETRALREAEVARVGAVALRHQHVHLENRPLNNNNRIAHTAKKYTGV